MSTAHTSVRVPIADMSWEGILAYAGTALASALAGGGLVAKLLDIRQARLATQAQGLSQAKSDDILDRQKLTQEIHNLYLGVAHQNEILHNQNEGLRREQIDYERRISKLERDCEIWQRMATESEGEITNLKAGNEVLERRVADCERRWSNFLKVRDS